MPRRLGGGVAVGAVAQEQERSGDRHDGDRNGREQRPAAGSGGGAITPSRSKSSSNRRSRPGGPAASGSASSATPQRSSSSRQSGRAGKPPAPARSSQAASPGGGASAPRAAAQTPASTRWPSPVTGVPPLGGWSSGRSRNGVGPGPTATSASTATSGENPAAATRSASRPNASASRAASAACRAAQHPPALDREAEARRQDEEPAIAVAAEVEHAADLAAADPAPARHGVGQRRLLPAAVDEDDPHLRAAPRAGVERVDRAERVRCKRGRARQVAVGDDVVARGGFGHASHATRHRVTGQHASRHNIATIRPTPAFGVRPRLSGQVRAWKMAVVTRAPSTPP